MLNSFINWWKSLDGPKNPEKTPDSIEALERQLTADETEFQILWEQGGRRWDSVHFDFNPGDFRRAKILKIDIEVTKKKIGQLKAAKTNENANLS